MAGITAIKNTGMIIPLAHGGVAVEGARVRVEVVGGDGEIGATTTNDDGDITIPPATENTTTTTITEEENNLVESQKLHHPLPPHGGIRISALVETTGKTGVEMEALCGVVGAGLTCIDMVKGVDKGCVLEEVKVIGKKGGRSGSWGVWGGG